MLRLNFQFHEQANWRLSWFACFLMCGVLNLPSWGTAQVQPSTAGQQKADSPDTDKPKVIDFADRVAGSISRLGSLEERSITESSGLARSAVADCFWTINDSGNPAEIFLFGNKGQHLARVILENATNKDWESLASFTFSGKRWGLVADVGDNPRKKTVHRLYFFRDPTDLNPRPELRSESKQAFEKLKTVQALPVEFTYQDRRSNGTKVEAANPIRQDCEAVAVDPTTLDIWFIEKVFLNRDRSVVPSIYVLPMPKTQLESHEAKPSGRIDSTAKASTKLVADRIGSFPIRNVTGMAFSPDGKKLIVRNYLTARLVIRPEGKTWRQTVVDQKPFLVALPLQRQGEAICFTADSNSVIVTSEGRRQRVWKIDLQVYFEKFASAAKPLVPKE